MWINYRSVVSENAEAVNHIQVEALRRSLLDVWRKGRTVFTCGNGGSASNANHLAQDLSKGTIVSGAPRLCAISLCDSVSALTAWANDEGYETVFAEQLATLGQEGDLLIAISGSGNSKNVLNAVIEAHSLGMRTWGICGFDGGHLKTIAHRSVHVPCNDMGMVEAIHGILFHYLPAALKYDISVEHDKRLSIVDIEPPKVPKYPIDSDGYLLFTDDGVYASTEDISSASWRKVDCNSCDQKKPEGGCRQGVGAWCPGVER